MVQHVLKSQWKVLDCGISMGDTYARNWRKGLDWMANATNLQSFATTNELTGTCCVFGPI
jgi:hypothetical protein